MRATINCHGGDLLIAHSLAGSAQASSDDAREIARFHAAGAKALRQRDQVVGAEGIFQLCQCAERKYETAARAADLGVDFPSVTIGHITPP